MKDKTDKTADLLSPFAKKPYLGVKHFQRQESLLQVKKKKKVRFTMYVRHFCGLQQLRTSSVLLFNLTAIAANKRKMPVLKPTSSNQPSVYVLKCYCNEINLIV